MLKAICAMLAIALASVPTLAAPAITTFDPPASVSTSPEAINAAGVIVGEFTDNTNLGHAFIRAADGTITTFDVSNQVANGQVVYTAATSINNYGTIAGVYSLANNPRRHGFLRAPDGTITVFAPVIDIDRVFIDDSGRIAGLSSTHPASGRTNTFVGIYRTVNGAIARYTVSKYTQPVGINNRGVTVGVAIDGEGDATGFTRSPAGVLTTFYAGPMTGSFEPSTNPTCINDSGVIAGSGVDYGGTGNVDFAFVRAPNGTITRFGVSKYFSPESINNAGRITGKIYSADFGTSQGFVRTAAGTVSRFNITGATYISPVMINASGVIIGNYTQNNTFHGFVRSAP